MGNDKRNTFKVNYQLNKRKDRIRQNGETPIILRLTINGETADLSISRWVHPKYWNQKRGECTAKDRVSQQLNEFLIFTKARMFAIQQTLINQNKLVTMNAVRDKYYGRDAESKKKNLTICDVFQGHNKECEELLGNGYEKSTLGNFETAFNHLKNFIKFEYGKDNLPLTSIDGEFVNKYEHYLKTSANKGKGLQHNSAMKPIKVLRKIILRAIANGWIDRDPFALYTIVIKETKRIRLTDVEFSKLRKITFTPEFEHLEQVRDFFVFCCFTGLAYIDLKTLKYEYIFDDQHGNQWIDKERVKTDVPSNIPLTTGALEIIEKYRDHKDSAPEHVFPVKTNQTMNGHLKTIANMCGIKKRLTTHTARHNKFSIPLKMSNLQEFYS